MSILTCNGRYFAWRSGVRRLMRDWGIVAKPKKRYFPGKSDDFLPKTDPFVEEWKASHENISENKVPKTGPEDFFHDLDPFAEMAQLMRKSSSSKQKRIL